MEVTGQNSVLVQNLSSLSRYLVSVQSHYPQGLSAAITSNVTTCKMDTLICDTQCSVPREEKVSKQSLLCSSPLAFSESVSTL